METHYSNIAFFVILECVAGLFLKMVFVDGASAMF